MKNEVRVGTSQPARGMLKGTSLFKRTLGENKRGQEQVTQLTSHPAPGHSSGHMAHLWPWSASRASPPGASLPCPRADLLRGAHLLRDEAAFPDHLLGPQGLLLPTAHPAPAHLAQLPEFQVYRLSPIWPDAQFLCHLLSGTQQEKPASK